MRVRRICWPYPMKECFEGECDLCDYSTQTATLMMIERWNENLRYKVPMAILEASMDRRKVDEGSSRVRRGH